MSKVITFSRQYPSYHPKKGEPTFFVEKFYNSLYSKNNLMDYPEGLTVDDSITGMKHHTVRAGHRFKVGDYFSPRVWSGVPYKSKQIILAPDTLIRKTWHFDIIGTDFSLSGRLENALTGEGFDLSELAKNDGLDGPDFFDWFCDSPDFRKKEEFHGQIICWSDKIEY
jgi:hypothetical protein